MLCKAKQANSDIKRGRWWKEKGVCICTPPWLVAEEEETKGRDSTFAHLLLEVQKEKRREGFTAHLHVLYMYTAETKREGILWHRLGTLPQEAEEGEGRRVSDILYRRRRRREKEEGSLAFSTAGGGGGRRRRVSGTLHVLYQ